MVGGLGNSVVIDGGTEVGFSTLYAHMKTQSSIHNNTKVTRGQVIGYMGNTGNSSGQHLHFGVYKRPKYTGYGKTTDEGQVDPEKYIEKP